MNRGDFNTTNPDRLGRGGKELKKDDLAMFVSEKTAVSQKAAGGIIDAVLEGICSALEKGDSISLVGCGSYKIVERSAGKVEIREQEKSYTYRLPRP